MGADEVCERTKYNVSVIQVKNIEDYIATKCMRAGTGPSSNAERTITYRHHEKRIRNEKLLFPQEHETTWEMSS